MKIKATPAVKKLFAEREKRSDKPDQQTIINYLMKRCSEDEGLGEDVLQEHKTFDKCFSYIQENAKKQAVNGCAMIANNVVYEWAEDYYRKDDKAEEEAKKKAEEERKAKLEKEKKDREAKAAQKKVEETKKEENKQITLFDLMNNG